MCLHCSNKNIILSINNDLVIHRQVKTNDIISRRFGDLMTPLSRVMRVQRVITQIYIVEVETDSQYPCQSICVALIMAS